jgi:tRNA-dihydrouridine synthase
MLVHSIVKALTDNIKVPIFCKIRVRASEEKTFEIVDKVVSAGCALLTVHGRTK